MNIENTPFTLIDWNLINSQKSNGENGYTKTKTFEQKNIRVRIVEYSPGYIADHWCKKGHIIMVLEGDLTIELEDGTKYFLNEGISSMIGDNANPHKAYSKNGAKVFIID